MRVLGMLVQHIIGGPAGAVAQRVRPRKMQDRPVSKTGADMARTLHECGVCADLHIEG
jgi:hypothetical protein